MAMAKYRKDIAAGKKVDNLISTIDYNNAQIDGKTDDVMPLGDVKAKWSAFGWDVMEMNGNNLEEVITTIKAAQQRSGKGKPVMIIMHTKMGMGVDFMTDNYKWHGSATNPEQTEKALAQLEQTLGDY
jgi:transketolase